MMFPEFDWTQLAGMNENQAETLMMKLLGSIPAAWNNPLFRDEVLGVVGGAELSAHMNFGEQAYGGESRLGDTARGVWHQRNIDGQGHPAEEKWKKSLKK